jgi:hypothetical protein
MNWAAPHDGAPHAPSMVVLTVGFLLFASGLSFYWNATNTRKWSTAEQARRWHRTMAVIDWMGRLGKIAAVVGVPVLVVGAIMWLATQ